MSVFSRLGLRKQKLSGLTYIVAGTLFAGIAAYAVTWLIPRSVGLAQYGVFAVFWGALYLVISALFGIQQEVTRGTTKATLAPKTARSAKNFALVAALMVFLSVTVTSFFWANSVFPTHGLDLVWPVAVGAVSFVFVAVLSGSLYGIEAWPQLAAIVILDAILRLLAVVITLQLTSDIVALAWAVVLPFALTIILLWPFIRKSNLRQSSLDVGYMSLTWNVFRTVIASASTGVMVSGLPLLIGLTSRGEPSDIIGLYILTITLSRAPLVVIAMSLQSYLIVYFREHYLSFWPTFAKLQLIVFGIGAVLASAGWLWGPAVFEFLFPGEIAPGGGLIAILVFSSSLMGSLFVSAPAVLALSKHLIYSAGWVFAALTTAAALTLPIEFGQRIVIALLAGPIAGIAIHTSFLAIRSMHGRVSPTTIPVVLSADNSGEKSSD